MDGAADKRLSMQMKLKIEYESPMDQHVLPFMDARSIPKKGQHLNIGGMTLEVRAVMKTPFSKLHAAIIYVREAQVFFQ